MSGKGSVSIFQPRNTAREKVRVVQGSVDELLAKADAAVDKLSDQFDGWARRELARLAHLVATAKAETANRPASLATIAQIAHELRGQGGTFGYPLVTEIAGSLFRFLDERRDGTLGDRALEVLELHADALRVVIEANLKGSPDKLARNLVDGLAEASARVLRTETP